MKNFIIRHTRQLTAAWFFGSVIPFITNLFDNLTIVKFKSVWSLARDNRKHN